MRTTAMILSAQFWAWAAVAADAPPLQHVNVFVSGADGYAGYRIPAIETTADGSLLAFAEARKYNLSDPGGKGNEIDLVLKRSTDGGATWSAMKLIEHSGEYWSSANPATVLDRHNGRVWVFYLRCQPGRGTDHARPGTNDVLNLARYSDDHGVTWSEPIDQTTVARDMADTQWRISVPGPGGAIQDRQGRLIVPMWRFAPWTAFAIFSEDHGRTWQRGAMVPGKQGGDEDQLVELADGRLLLDIRQHGGPHRWLATSSDGGRTWSEPRPGQPVTPVCCAIERYTLKSAGDDRDRILWTGPAGPGRKKLVVRTSFDEGQAFTQERVISDEPAAYSDLTLLKDRSVGVLWERGNYRFLTFTRLTRDFLEPPAQADVLQPAPGRMDWFQDLKFGLFMHYIRMERVVRMARGHQPHLIVVDRTVGTFEDYRTPEQEVPEHPRPYVWETCMTMGEPQHAWVLRFDGAEVQRE